MKTINLEELKAKQAEEIRLAELANEINSKLSLSAIIIMGKSCTQKGCIQAYVNVDNLQQLAEILNTYQPDEDCAIYVGKSDYVYDNYDIQTHRYPNQTLTEMEISYIFKKIDLSIKIGITSEIGALFFKETTRALESSELSSFGIKSTRWTYNMRNWFKYLIPNSGKMVCFRGGYMTSNCHSWKNALIEHIKYSYE